MGELETVREEFTGGALPGERGFDDRLRPQSLEEMVGQDRLRVIEAGEPKKGAMIQIMSPDGLKQGTTGKDGVYRKKNLRPGDYQVNIVDSGAISIVANGDP